MKKQVNEFINNYNNKFTEAEKKAHLLNFYNVAKNNIELLISYSISMLLSAFIWLCIPFSPSGTILFSVIFAFGIWGIYKTMYDYIFIFLIVKNIQQEEEK